MMPDITFDRSGLATFAPALRRAAGKAGILASELNAVFPSTRQFVALGEVLTKKPRRG